MLLLTTTAHATMLRWEHKNHGRLITPRCRSRIEDTSLAGIMWAVDNDGFSGFDAEAFIETVKMSSGISGCIFVNAPDAFCKDSGIGDSKSTLMMWREWYPFLYSSGLPLSFVIQDGCAAHEIPWDEISAIFIGGSTEWKLGPQVEKIVYEAKARGKWAHMGRVNSEKRIAYAKSILCDSVDGSGWARFRDSMMPRGLAAASVGEQVRFDFTKYTAVQ